MPKVLPPPPTSEPTEAPTSNGSDKKKAKKKPSAAKSVRELLYPRVEFHVYILDPEKVPTGYEPQALTAEIAKKYLQWQTEEDYAAELAKQYSPEELKKIDCTFGDDYLLKDENGSKVRCLANLRNRPFDRANAETIKLEILRQKWRFNGEAMIIDKFGMGQDLQHRLIGLVLAEQVWAKDKLLPKPEQDWQKLWPDAPCIECYLVLGIDDTDDVINTINTGKPRTLADALYRCDWFAKKGVVERDRLSKICANATRLLWDRTEARNTSLAPRRPHSESFEFIEHHKSLLKCVQFISDEGDGKKLNTFLPLGYAAALMYLFAAARSDYTEYDNDPTEKSIDLTLMEKAEEFFVLFCSKAKELESLVKCLDDVPEDAGGYETKLRLGLFIKAWDLFSEGKKVTADKIAMELDRDGEGNLTLVEFPRIGGIDVEREEVREPIEEKGKKDETLKRDKAGKALVDGTSNECLKGGEHDYVMVQDENGKEFLECSKCRNPLPAKPSKKKGGKK